jgi:hypothetical protein
MKGPAMKKLLLAVLPLIAAASTYAATHAGAPKAEKELTPQQKLMGVCNKEAAGLKGDEFKKKRDTCLADGRKRQNEVMKACAAENKGKKGEEYKAAQKACLSKS